MKQERLEGLMLLSADLLEEKSIYENGFIFQSLSACLSIILRVTLYHSMTHY